MLRELAAVVERQQEDPDISEFVGGPNGRRTQRRFDLGRLRNRLPLERVADVHDIVGDDAETDPAVALHERVPRGVLDEALWWRRLAIVQ